MAGARKVVATTYLEINDGIRIPVKIIDDITPELQAEIHAFNARVQAKAEQELKRVADGHTQLVAESIQCFNKAVARCKEMFLLGEEAKTKAIQLLGQEIVIANIDIQQLTIAIQKLLEYQHQSESLSAMIAANIQQIQAGRQKVEADTARYYGEADEYTARIERASRKALDPMLKQYDDVLIIDLSIFHARTVRIVEVLQSVVQFCNLMQSVNDLSRDPSVPKSTAEKLKAMADNVSVVEPRLQDLQTRVAKLKSDIQARQIKTEELGDDVLSDEFQALKSSLMDEREEKQFDSLPLLSLMGITDKAVLRKLEQANTSIQQLQNLLVKQNAKFEQVGKDLDKAQEEIIARLEAEDAAEKAAKAAQPSAPPPGSQFTPPKPSTQAITKALFDAHAQSPQAGIALTPPGGLAIQLDEAKAAYPSMGKGEDSPTSSQSSFSSCGSSRRDSISSTGSGSNSDRSSPPSPPRSGIAAAAAPVSPVTLPISTYQSPPPNSGKVADNRYTLAGATAAEAVAKAAAASRQQANLHAAATAGGYGYRPATAGA